MTNNTNNMIATLDYGPLKNDITHALKVEDDKILEINKKLENTQTKDKGTLELVQQRELLQLLKKVGKLSIKLMLKVSTQMLTIHLLLNQEQIRSF